jgi:hypothetical protein
MKWLKRKIRNWINEPYEDTVVASKGISLHARSEFDRPDTEPVLNFRIYSAENGKVLEFNRYDRVKDKSQCTIYIIGKDEDIAEKVSKCVTLETMR